VNEDTISVLVVLPGVLRDLAGGHRELTVTVPLGASVGDALSELRSSYPVLGRRICDETGSLRKYVNVFADGDNVRGLGGLSAPVKDGTTLDVLPSVAGGASP
jgi:molybdopterin converting factor small subunit